MSETKATAEEVSKLVDQLNALKSFEDKCAFYHANPAIHGVVRGIHYPKPADKTTE